MEILELLEKILEKIIDIIPGIAKVVGIIGCIPTLAILIISIIVPIFESIYNTSIEKIFMKPIKRKINTTVGIMVLLVGCVLKNLIFSIDTEIYGIGIILGSIAGLVFFYYKFRVFQINKISDDLENSENVKRLDKYYKCKKQRIFLYATFTFLSCLLIWISNIVRNNLVLVHDILVSNNIEITDSDFSKIMLHFSNFNCVIIIGLIEIIIVCIYMPELIKTPSNLYIYNNNKKTYIYKKIDEENVLCGNNSDINDSDRYMILSCEYLRGKKISRDTYRDNLSFEEKRELIEEINRKFLEKLKEKFR